MVRGVPKNEKMAALYEPLGVPNKKRVESPMDPPQKNLSNISSSITFELAFIKLKKINEILGKNESFLITFKLIV